MEGSLCPMMMMMMPSGNNQAHQHDGNNPNSATAGYFVDNHLAGNHHSCDDIATGKCGGSSSSTSSSSAASVKAKIMAHPYYNRLLASYFNCQKIGAPPEVVGRLEEACAAMGGGRSGSSCLGEDPALDQFMEAYCEMLTKYEEELSKPFKEAMIFLSRIDSQFKALTLPSSSHSPGGMERNYVSSEEEDGEHNNNNSNNRGCSFIDPEVDDRELKGQLLRKYSGYLGSLKQEFMKKKKKGKLPKEARQQLLEWWTRHYKWPYPSESQKVALAESTGLDQKQINNWFINQRKRHWKPSEDMQFVVMDSAHHPHHFYMQADHNNNLPLPSHPFSIDITPSSLL